jgi:hypothetical protein
MIHLHLRVSTDRQEKEGHGLAAQEATGREIFHGRKVVVHKEQCSGRKEQLMERPILRATLESMRERDILWFYDEDRMSRDNGVKKEILKVLRKKKANLQIRNEEFDIYDIQDCLRLGLKGEMDEYMGAWLVQRMKAGRDIAVLKKGRWYGGITPFGYRKIEGNPNDPHYHNLEREPKEAKAYRDMVRWSLNGIGTNKIAHRLNELGVPTNFSKKGKQGQSFKWKQSVVTKMFRNPIYKGDFYYKGKIIKVPALISEKEWNRLQEQLRKNAIYSPRNTRRFYLLRRLLVCSNCGRYFFGKIKEKKRERVYVCLSKRPDPHPRNCGMPGINIDKANEAVWSQVRGFILQSKTLKEAIRQQKDTSFVDRAELEANLTSIERQIAVKEKEIKRLIRRQGCYRNISDNELDEAVGEVKSERGDLLIRENELKMELSKLQSLDDRAKKIEDFLSTLADKVDDLSDEEKREVLYAVLNRVFVTYSKSLKKHHLKLEFALKEDELVYKRPILDTVKA